jgi:poly(hydroxyalkanoate) depolymerase family esterase
MTDPTHHEPPTETKDHVQQNFQQWMQEATRLTRAGQLGAATAAIQRALGNVPAASTCGADPDDVIDGCVTVLPDAGRHAGDADGHAGDADRHAYEVDRHANEVDKHANEVDGHATTRPAPGAPPAAERDTPSSSAVAAPPSVARHEPSRDDFRAASHTLGGLTRRYKLYVPPDAAGRALPLVVMLHGCKQDADDFAAGTGMNDRARAQGFFVLYPEQAHGANPSRCWNWFKHNHQGRERGEAALIASLTRAVVRSHGIDVERVYIAGLSAGGAMAAQVACMHPDLFAAVGVHSGLPAAAARNLAEGLAAMKSGLGGCSSKAMTVPAIVFHGDGDGIVHPGNADAVVDAVLRGAPLCNARRVDTLVEPRDATAGGYRCTRSTWTTTGGDVIAEAWRVHGGGHAWFGGRAAGSYTDARGPDASGEMLRFFLARRRRG